MPPRAASTRSVIGILASPKWPMPIVVVQTIASVTMNAAAAANTGRQRDEIHSRIGNSSAIGRTVVQGSIGNAIAMTLMTTSNASAVRPSIVSLGLGGSRAAEASPITSGAIVTMPSASEANQFCQVLKAEVVSPCNKTNPRILRFRRRRLRRPLLRAGQELGATDQG